MNTETRYIGARQFQHYNSIFSDINFISALLEMTSNEMLFLSSQVITMSQSIKYNVIAMFV